MNRIYNPLYLSTISYYASLYNIIYYIDMLYVLKRYLHTLYRTICGVIDAIKPHLTSFGKQKDGFYIFSS